MKKSSGGATSVEFNHAKHAGTPLMASFVHEGVKYFNWKDCKAPPLNFNVMTRETGQSVCGRINELLSVCQE